VTRVRPFVLLALGFLYAGSAAAQSQVGGFVEYDNITYFKSPDSTKINGRNQAILQTELRFQADPAVDLFGSIEFRVDQADPTRDRVFLDEAYIDFYAGSFDVRVGKQIYAWGRADALNPTDNLAVWDYSDVLDTDDEKIGQVSARVEYYAGDWILEGVVVPSFTPSVLPTLESRWFPPFPESIPNPVYPEFGEPTLETSLTTADPVLPDEGLASTQYAVKLSGQHRGWDFSISWFDGFDDLLVIETRTVVDSGFSMAEIVLTPNYRRRRTIGLDFATTFGGLGVRGEGAYNLTDDWDGSDALIDDPYLEYTLGLDYTIRDLLPESDLFVLVEWVQQVQVPDRGTVDDLFDLNHVFRKALFAKMDLGLGEFSGLTIEGVYNFETGDWLVRPSIEWSIMDGLELDLLVDLLGGPEESFFGSFRHNRRFQLRLKYSFLAPFG